MANLVGDLGDPQKDAAAFAPVVQQFETSLTGSVIPALVKALTDMLQGQKVTITLTVEPKAAAAAAVTPTAKTP